MTAPEELEEPGPVFYGTDHGGCCFFSPFQNMDPYPVDENGVSNWTAIYHDTDYSSKHGRQNGMSVLLNVEQWNYGYNPGKGAGFRVALMDPRDKPMMQFSSLYVQGGAEMQINIKPTVTYTTQEAIDKFDPINRNCYVEGENELILLPWIHGFRYQMDNCLANQGMVKIYWECGCFNALTQADDISVHLAPCHGEGLACANKIKAKMGSFGEDAQDQGQVGNQAKIGNFSRPDLKPCLPACHFQDNPYTITSVQFPPEENFLLQNSFCHVASQILQRSCRDENRTELLEHSFPKMCDILEEHAEFFDNGTDCSNWPESYFESNEKINSTLQNAIRDYGKTNLALMHVFHQSPYVTKIKRSVEMTFTGFVSNTGGLLGLYLGFSFISAVELFYWILMCCKRLCKNPESCSVSPLLNVHPRKF